MQQYILIGLLATMVYAVSLDLRIDDFRHVARHPLAVGIGPAAQFSSNVEMVSVAGLWGIWHLISGGTLAFLWRRASGRVAHA